MFFTFVECVFVVVGLLNVGVETKKAEHFCSTFS